jgi:NDP-sugar pyrophosphorylase family protein
MSEDFLVMYADNITNISLNEMATIHFDKKQDLKNVVLTTAVRKGLSSQIYVLNSSTNEILQIDSELNK